MIKNTRLTLAISMLVLLSACESFKATVLPQQNNTYTSIATASNQQDALEHAVGKATEVCKKQNKQLVVLNREEESKSDNDTSGLCSVG